MVRANLAVVETIYQSMPVASIDSPVGRLCVVENDGQIVRLLWASGSHETQNILLKVACDQLRAYFAGDLQQFDLPLAPVGNTLQQSVYQEMSKIPFGETRTYGEIAKSLNTSAQPVGGACGSNPIPIIIPCHRVVAANGLGGYSGADGIDTKIALLRLENAIPNLI